MKFRGEDDRKETNKLRNSHFLAIIGCLYCHGVFADNYHFSVSSNLWAEIQSGACPPSLLTSRY